MWGEIALVALVYTSNHWLSSSPCLQASIQPLDEQLPPVVQWAAHLPEGAFVEFESCNFVIPKGEHRATKLSQLRSLATLVKQVLEIRDLTDDNQYSATHGELITWPMVNMYVYRSYLRCAYDFALCSLCLRFCFVSGTTYVTLL